MPPRVAGCPTTACRRRDRRWWRDFNTRADFDDFFAGAEIGLPKATGDFPLARHRLTAVSTKDGLVRGFTQVGGAETRFTWQRFGDVQAVVRIDEQVGGRSAKGRNRWTTVVHVGLVPVGPHLLPATLKLEQVFGEDWGPETLLLKNLRLR